MLRLLGWSPEQKTWQVLGQDIPIPAAPGNRERVKTFQQSETYPYINPNHFLMRVTLGKPKYVYNKKYGGNPTHEEWEFPNTAQGIQDAEGTLVSIINDINLLTTLDALSIIERAKQKQTIRSQIPDGSLEKLVQMQPQILTLHNRDHPFPDPIIKPRERQGKRKISR